MFNHIGLSYIPQLTRKEIRGERWYVTEAGNSYPSVTTILSCEPKPGLEAWKNAMGAKKAKKEVERCSERGTNVHSMIELHLSNADHPTENQLYENVCLFNRAKPLINNIDNIRCLEQYLYSDTLKLAGCVDCIAEYKGVLSIIDFKTSNGNKSEDVIFDYFLQCTAYAIMYSELFNEYIEDIVVLITPEKSNCFPMIYRKKIDEYVAPLLQRIDKFRTINNG